jgi:hypothetical protein
LDTVKSLEDISNTTFREIRFSSPVIKVDGDPTLLTMPKLMVVFGVLFSNVRTFRNLPALTNKSKFTSN